MSGASVLIQLFAPALLLTMLIEVAAGWLLFGLRTWRELAVVALAQVATNPLVELLCLAVGWDPTLTLTSTPWLALLAGELAALVVEALLYRTAEVGAHPWAQAAVLNVLSFGVGLLLPLMN